MIQVENVEVFNFEGAIRGMRNPMNSWDKSDSDVAFHAVENFVPDDPMAEKYQEWNDNYGLNIKIGKNDLDLMHRLYVAGNPHRKYLRQIFVSMDITAPLYWISECDTYKVGTTRNSCSFMHRGVSKKFDICDFSIHDDRVYEILSPIEKKEYPIVYPYETKEYKEYTTKNGRKYKVYRNGRIVAKAYKYTDTMNRNRVFEETECKPSKTPHGYYEIRLGGKNGEKWLLHRLIATLWIENPDNLYTVNHINGNKGDSSVENLEWCSLADNIRKGYDDGLYENIKSLHSRYARWKNGHSIFDPFTRSQLTRDHVQDGMTCRELSEKYDITISQANNIISRIVNDNEDLFMLCYTWETIIDTLNDLRNIYLETKNDAVFQQIRCLLPSGYNQRFTLTMTYENVFNIINQRQNHRLSEWREFCRILKELPYVTEIMEG